MIKEYEDKYYNEVLVLGREINDNYKLNLNSISKCYMYMENNEVIGFILADIFDDRSEIIDVAVNVMHRNKKIGDKLVKYIIDLSKNSGCDNITLEVKVNNNSAIKLYQNNGFKVISVRKKYYSNGTIDAYLMERKL